MPFAEFSIDSLIDDYGRINYYKIDKNKGTFDNAGVYIPPLEEWTEGFGIVVNLSAQDFQLDTEGAYTVQDKNYYTRDNLEVGVIVKDFEGIYYVVHSRFDVSPYDQTPVRAYKLKRRGDLLGSSKGQDF